MDTKTKRQLGISLIMVCLLLTTLFLWYDNFVFHTYMSTVDYQFCFEGENDDVMVQGYEFYQNQSSRKHGGARLAAKKQGLFLNGDSVTMTFEVKTKDEKSFQYAHKYTIKNNDEAFYIDEQETKDSFTEKDFYITSMDIAISRKEKKVYSEKVSMKAKPLMIYNGGNKDYTIQNVYVTNDWIKTGYLSSTVKDIVNQYPYMTIDYLYLKDNGSESRIDDYERFINIKGKTQEFLDGQLTQTVIYDGKDSLLDKTLACVITLSEKKNFEEPYLFKINLHGLIKEGDVNE